MILGIETATSVCGAAIVHEGMMQSSSSVDERYVHAERLLTLVDEVLRNAGVPLSGLDAVAVSIGPGSFTGLRIGLSTATGLAHAVGLKLVAVPTLEALALRLVGDGVVPEGGAIVSALDARRDEVYVQVFEIERGALMARTRPADGTVREILESLPRGRVVATGDGATKLLAANTVGLKDLVAAPPGLSSCSAETVALLGERLLRDGQTAAPGALEPLYIKEFFLKPRY